MKILYYLQYFYIFVKNIKYLMKKIKNILSSNVIAIDIETVRIKKTFSELSEDFQSAWEYKNKQDGVVPDFETLSSLWEKNASLYPEFSKVVAVSLVYFSKGKLKCKEYASIEEELILQELSADLNSFQNVIKGVTLIGHSSFFYDYPFLCKRFIINSMDIPSILDESGSSPWEKKLLCTNELWKSFGAFNSSGSSLQALCTCLGIEVSKVDLVGDQVGKAYYDGEISRIAAYCSLDTIATYNVFRKFKKEPTFSFEDVEYVNQGQILVSDPLFSSIMEEGAISAANTKKLTVVSKDLSRDERENLVLILKACLKKKDDSFSKAELTLFDKLCPTK